VENGESIPLRSFVLCNLNPIRAIKSKEYVIGGECDRDARNKKCIQNLVGKPEWKRPRKTEA
jgi:hypothetical protein